MGASKSDLPLFFILSYIVIRYARKDRRPLDPPPVVQLKFFYAFPGTETPDREVENYELR